MDMYLAMAAVLAALLAGPLVFTVGWYLGRCAERRVGRMLWRQHHNLDPYDADGGVMEQDKTA